MVVRYGATHGGVGWIARNHRRVAFACLGVLLLTVALLPTLRFLAQRQPLPPARAPPPGGQPAVALPVRIRAAAAAAAAARSAGLAPAAPQPAPADLHWHVFRSPYAPPFRIALPDPASDHNTRVILSDAYEEPLGDVFRVLLSGRCRGGAARVLDIGANLGVFAAASAAFGCTVTAVEAQSRLVPYLQQTAAANTATWVSGAALEVLNAAVYDAPGSLTIAYYNASRAGWLSAAMDAEAIRTCGTTLGCTLETVPVVTTAQLVDRDHVLVKIDVDGPEAVIAKALLPALRSHAVESILIEVCPGSWHDMISRREGLAVLRALMSEFSYDLLILNQIEFSAYPRSFLDQLQRLEGVFRPRAYVVPERLLDELFDDSTTTINCKNVVFTNLASLVSRFAEAGGLLVAPPL